MRNKNVTFMVQAAMIAAIYVVLVVVFKSCSFGPIQFRFAEVLTVLPYFTPAAIPGLFVGCLLANFLAGEMILADIIFGSIATLLGAIGTYLLSRMKVKWLAPIPPIVANAVIVPFVLKYGYGLPDAVWYMMITVGLSEVIVCAVLGLPLLFILEKYKDVIFGLNDYGVRKKA